MRTGVPEVPATIDARGWVLYDGTCPLCRRGARRLGGIVTKRGFRLRPLQLRWVQEVVARQSAPVADEMLLLLPDGRLLGGVDAYIHLAWRVWWASPFAALASIPGLHWLARKLYRWVAANRFGISRACGLDGCRVEERAGSPRR